MRKNDQCSVCGGPPWVEDERLVDSILDLNPVLGDRPICQGCLMKAEALGFFSAQAFASNSSVEQVLEGILANYGST